jgi:single-strand binding protein
MNKVMLIGNVGKDPEIRYIDNGVCTAKVVLATNTPGYTLPNGTQVPDRAEWHNLLFWRKIAEVVERYVRKGDKLYVEGELRTRNYTDHQGIVRYITEIWVNNMEMLTPKSQSSTANTPSTPEAPKTEAPF